MPDLHSDNPKNPWFTTIATPEPSIDASFVEYLRWMRLRSDNNSLNSARLTELLQQAGTRDYSEALDRLTNRTKRLATESFIVECPWRIRVGGVKGPESMLLPAFDALGMPYISSSTLKGAARAIAEQDKSIKSAQIQMVFGAIQESSSCMGLVTFLDAYPLPGESKLGGLMLDMANAIWTTWTSDCQPPDYDPKPNQFLSLQKPQFVIGLRQNKSCSNEILMQVKQWLLRGLIQGVGSRTNSGYGELRLPSGSLQQLPREQHPKKKSPIITIPFELEGQLIHGAQKVSWKESDGGIKPKLEGIAEVRPIAFRSMLRFWFRALALGMLSPEKACSLELEIFGGIRPSQRVGRFQLEISNGKTSDPDHHQEGKLILRHAPLLSLTLVSEEQQEQQAAIGQLLKTLTWFMFHLGGIGQGARRPFYQRNGNPSIRGVNLEPKRTEVFPEKERADWQLPLTPKEFKVIFQQKLANFYQVLGVLSPTNSESTGGEPTEHSWAEVVDQHCKILVFRKALRQEASKPFPLTKLHEQFHDLDQLNYTTAKSLCGGIKEDRVGQENRKTVPSPIWIANLQKYQVITVFGATEDPRKAYVEALRSSITQNGFDSCLRVYPLSSEN